MERNGAMHSDDRFRGARPRTRKPAPGRILAAPAERYLGLDRFGLP